METCYRHPSRETGVSCSNCGKAICPDCMTSTPVGMRCPDCARQRTPVRTVASLDSTPVVTVGLIAVNVLVFLGGSASGGGLGGGLFGGGGGGRLFDSGALYGPAIAQGHEYWRLVTSGFLHAGLGHLAFNMYALYLLGQMLEPSLGRVRFSVLYAVSLLAGSLGALLLSPNAATVGASGAIFGLFGGAFVAMRARGFDPMRSGLGAIIGLNLAFTFLFAGQISIGGHLGGLAGGALVAYLLVSVGERRRSFALPLAACGALALAVVAGAIAVATSSSGLG